MVVCVSRRARRAFMLVVLIAVASAACRATFARKYEYDEDVFVALDGSATVYLNASVAALVALRGVDLDVDPRARLDRHRVRALFDSPVTRVTSVTTSRREGRRYVHIRMEIDDVRKLSEVAPFAWSRYAFDQQNDVFVYKQTIGAAAGRDVGSVGWNGDELVAFRLHLPSRVPFHNSPTREIERGNIIVWEQPLAVRMKSEPIAIEVHMETASILVRTLTLFAITIVLAGATFAAAIWWVMRRGKKPVSFQFPVDSSKGAIGCRRSEMPFELETGNWKLTARTTSGGVTYAPAGSAGSESSYEPIRSNSTRTSSSVFSAFFTSNDPNPVASDRASIRSTLLFTTPVNVTRPRLTTM